VLISNVTNSEVFTVTAIGPDYITGTLVNGYSGVTTLGPVGGGVQEAINFATSVGGGTVKIERNITVHGTIIFPPANNKYIGITITGTGMGGQVITRAADFPSGDIFLWDCTGSVTKPAPTFKDMTIMAGSLDGSIVNTSGAAIHLRNGYAVPVTINNVQIYDSYVGVEIENTNLVTVNGGDIHYHSLYLDKSSPFGGYYIHGGEVTQIALNNIQVNGAANTAGQFNAGPGIYITSADGVFINNPQIIQVSYGILVFYNNAEQPLNGFVGGIWFNGGQCDWIGVSCIDINNSPNPGGIIDEIHIDEMHLGVNNVAGNTSADGITVQGAAIKSLSITGNRIFHAGQTGIYFTGTSSIFSVVVSGNTIVANGTRNLGSGGITTFGVIGGSYTITGNSIKHDASDSTSHQDWGIWNQATGTYSMVVSGNTLVGSVAPIALDTIPTKFVLTGNNGLDDIQGSVASGASLTLPIYSNFLVTGVTGVNTVTVQWAGRSGTFITPDGAVTFTAGASIGNTFTTTQNVPVSYYSDGTKVWLH
jgi:hypothetical protein